MGTAVADIDGFLLSAWRVSQCDRRKEYGPADYEKRIHRLRPGDAPGAPVRHGGAETPPDVGFVGENYRGVLFLGMNPGRGESRGPSERKYFAEVVKFREAKSERSAPPIGRRVLAEERRMALHDPWPLHSLFMLPLLNRVSRLGKPLKYDQIVRLNVARSKTVVAPTDRMARICFHAHTREQIGLLDPRVIVCCYKRTGDWLQKWGADIVGDTPVEVIGALAYRPLPSDMERAAITVAKVLAG